MKNELRTIADNYHTKKQAEHTLKLQNYVSRYVLPEIRKIAERGGYQYRIENFNHAFKNTEIASVLESYGLEIKQTPNGLKAIW
jgi:hypothetical protein